ncbi:MAG: sigma-70 family RNA polymerase sigma factor [Phycisphaeraceae bacterium]
MTDEGAKQDWLEAQVRQHGRVLFVIACRVLGDATAAEDVCQQAFMKAWQWHGRLEAGADDAGDEPEGVAGLTGVAGPSIGPWLRKVVTNESLALLRRRRTEAASRPTVARMAPRAAVDPAERVAQREFVAAALAELPEPTQTVVRLRTMDGLSGNEVARALDCSASEVSRRLHAGMDQLRRALTRQDPEVGP